MQPLSTTQMLLRILLFLMNDWYDRLGEIRSTKLIQQNYDFIIVGGGTSGAVVASRLSENPNIRVLLLEAGGSGSDASDVPICSRCTVLSKLTHRYYTVPQKYACGETGICEHAVAIVLGGGSVHNEMGFLRGNPRDFDEWASKEGAPGWSYEEVLPYFKKLENVEPGLGDDTFRGREGPVYVKENIGNGYRFSPYTQMWMDAAKELGHPTGDYNGERHTVFAPLQVNINKKGRRVSSDNAYIKPIEQTRKNLDILMFANVVKILFKGRAAIGVEYVRKNQKHRVYATKEVIISAGAFNTPKLLMLSGIGPRDQLTEHKIPPVLYSEGVGRNFQDHPTLFLNYTANMPAEPVLSVPNFLDWLVSGKALGSTFGTAIGVLNTSVSKDYNDAQARNWFHVRPDPNMEAMVGFSVINTVWKPTSVGRVWLRSADYRDPPMVDPNYLATPEDRQNMYEALSMAMKMMRTAPFRKIQTQPVTPIVPRCQSKFELWSEEYLRCISESESQTEWHYCCTAKMGKNSDPLAVLDERLHVRNISKLRVIDASVMPSVTRANTNAASFMIGEKGADLVKEDWGLIKQ